jgi:PKD repeat protein
VKSVLGEYFEFEATLLSGESLNWHAGDGNSSSSNPYTHRYLQTGSFDAQLIVTNRHNCRDSMLMQNAVQVHPSPTAAFSVERLSSFGLGTTYQN